MFDYPPPEPGPLVTAALWLQGILTGTVATTTTIIAVAAIGFRMLTGRVDLRRGLGVIAGCFLLFGAAGIVAGLRAFVDGTGRAEEPALVDSPPPPLPPPAPQRPMAYDPNSGASVPEVR